MKSVQLLHKLAPRLILTPQLRQALYILQLPQVAFKEYLLQKISENPLLQSSSEESLNAKIKNILNSNDSKYQRNRSNFNETIGEQTRSIEEQKSDTINLQDYLSHQVGMTFLNEEELSIAQDLISNIDANGYLRISLDQFAKEHNMPLKKTEKILETIHNLEPVGVGAKNLQECLLIQLKDKERERSLAYKIVQSYFKELTRKKYPIISKELHCSLDEVEKAVKEIISLNPKPGASISQEKHTIAIKPDIILKVHKNRLKIVLEETDLPTLKINSEYKKILNDPDASEETKEFIKERLKSALWFIKAKEERRKNILKVIQVITRIQKQALWKDISYLKPLRLRDIAYETGLHLSTVGRITSNKYISTPQGIIKIKDLLSPKLTSSKDSTISRKNVLSKINNLVLNENRVKPITDQIITDTLHKEGINISRRTITKYRNILKIPPSYLR